MGKISSFIFVGCMFLGIGIGVLFGEKQTGTLIGMGVGFIGMAVLYLVKKG